MKKYEEIENKNLDVLYNKGEIWGQIFIVDK